MLLGRTLSIVAVDRRSGEMGAAVLSHSFAAGSKTIWSESGVGVVVVQGTVEPTYGTLGLALLKGGKSPAHALKSLLATDPRPGVRQVMLIDSKGRVAAHTGKGCLPEAGFVSGRGFCVQASFVGSKRAWRSAAAGLRAAKGSLAERMVAGLEAGATLVKGARSAALMVVATLPTNTPWDGKLLDLRVEDEDSPLRELRRTLRVEEAYERAEVARELLSKGDLLKGEREFSKAISQHPKGSELRLWLALSLLRAGEARRGKAMLRSAVGRGRDVKTLMRELAARGIIDAPVKGSRGRAGTAK